MENVFEPYSVKRSLFQTHSLTTAHLGKLGSPIMITRTDFWNTRSDRALVIHRNLNFAFKLKEIFHM